MEDLYEKILMNQIIIMVSHPEQDILEYEVQRALGITAVNKASGCDTTLVEIFKTLEDDAVMLLHSIYQQIWQTQQWHRTGKGQSSAQFPRKVVLKYGLTNRQFHSSHMLVRSYLNT